MDSTPSEHEPRLRTRVARGGAWLLALRMVEQLFRIARLVVLANVLAPNDFGLMGVALLTLGTLQTFSESGFHAALIQKKDDVRPYLNTVWTVSVVRGAALCGLLWLLAPAAAGFFGVPAAVPVIRVIGLALLLQGFTNVAVVLFQKELEFHRQFAYQAAGTFVDFAVAVGAALWLGSVWALVFGLLAGEAARLIVSYVVHDYRPRPEVNLRKARELWGYGRWILGSTILVFLSTQGDDIVVGKLLGATALGLYQLAYRLSNLPATEFSRLVAAVSFPAFAKLQGNRELLRRGYLKVLQLTTLVAAPVAAAIFVFAEDFTRVVLSDKWMPMVPALQVLALLGMLRAIAGPGPLFLALGKPQWRTHLQLAGLVVLAALIVPFTLRWGIVGAAIAATVRVAVIKSASVIVALRAVQAPVGATLKMLLTPLLNAGLCGLAVHAASSLVLPADGLWQLALLLALGGALYLGLARLFDPLFGVGNAALLREQLQALAGRA